MTPLLEVKGLNVSFSVGKDRLIAIRDLDLTIGRGDSVSFIGESGSGKSVIASAILASLERNATVTGEVLFNGESIYKMSKSRLNEVRGKGICIISQNASQSFDPLMRIGPQMDELLIKTGTPKERCRDVSTDMLAQCGFDDPESILRTYPHRLSGGMAQRVMIAMCVATDPELLIADEPTKGLDGLSCKAVIDLMTKLGTSRSLLMITHDLYMAGCCKRTAVLYGGVIVEDGPSERVLSNPLHPYTEALKMSCPINGMHPIPNGSLRPPLEGCPFHNRCASADDTCRCQMPPVTMREHMVRCYRA